jgi:8-oxo-dGTP pyrophosphatase MutT (NUDIX family)
VPQQPLAGEAEAYEAVDEWGARLQVAIEQLLHRVVVASGQAHALKMRSAELRTLKPPVKTTHPAAVGMRFDVSNPRAINWAKKYGAKLVADIIEETRKAIALTVASGIKNGRTIRETAKLLREMIGLTERQGQALLNYREQLELEGLEGADLDDEVSARAGEMIETRADTIAHTETMRASNEGQQELWDQAVDDGLLTGSELKEWIVTPDDRLCPICEAMEGLTTALDGEFDVNGEAVSVPPAHPNCRCTIGISAESPGPRTAGGPGSGNFGHTGRPGELGGSGEGTSGAAERWKTGEPREGVILNGIELKADPNPDFSKSVNHEIEEPPLVPVRGKGISAGVVITEPDGRVWLYEPKSHYGGYRASFPKGRVDAGESLQQAAAREAWEESGLVAKIDGHLVDVERTTSVTRFYTGTRVGGAPWAGGNETHAVRLVDVASKHAEKALVNVDGQKTSDHTVLNALRTKLGKQ